MKKFLSILTALTLVTAATTNSLIPIGISHHVKKHKVKNHNDNEENNEEDIDPEEEENQFEHAQKIAEYIENQEFDFTDNELLQANGEIIWKQGFDIIEKILVSYLSLQKMKN